MSPSDSLPLSLAKRVSEACDRFEAEWKVGQRPTIEDYVAAIPEPERPALLRELLVLEIELRENLGHRPAPQEYEHRFPSQGELIRAVFADAGATQSYREMNGEPNAVYDIPYDDCSEVDQSTPLPGQPPPVIPDRIGRYQVCRWLGGGTFGDVYLAWDDLMERQVAIKVPSPKLLAAMGREASRYDLVEARIVSPLQHEGIVRAYDFELEGDGGCYIVYEFIEGPNLAERMASEPLRPDEAARIVAQVAEALHYAHLNDRVHRDIKPANILLDAKGKPHVTDFGLAVREEDLPKERGRFAGTLPYMSPEQVRCEGHHIDGRSDIYGLGVVLYELLCQRRPFDAKDEDELKDQILHRQAKPPRQIKDSIPQELERICLRAISKRVQDRYTTAKDMAEEILKAIEPSNRARIPDTALSVQEIERRMESADEDELSRLLILLQKAAEPVCVPQIFRCLGHPSQKVRQIARMAVHRLGWDKVSDAAEDLSRRDDSAGIGAVLDGLAAFEAHPQVVALLDRLLVLLKGDLRNRTIMLLERKRLGLELEKVASLFRDIHSPYHIEKALGQGLLAAAYLAHAEGTDLAVVVRVLRPELAGQPHLRAQFLDANKRALQLVHENLVLTREARAFPDRSVYFAVRDHVEGVTLQKLLEGGKRFEPAQIVRILRQLLGALGTVHRRGLVHGGVKPSNIFVCQEDRVVLGDLSLPVQGIGVALERLSYDYRYAAPELFCGSGTASLESDFYSLGCVAYELACGQPPFVSDNYLELASRHIHETIVPPSQRGSQFGPSGDEVLLKMLGRSPGNRYARAEVLQALDLLDEAWRLGKLDRGARGAPLLRDASLAHFRGSESVLGFEPSVTEYRLPASEAPPLPPSAEVGESEPTLSGATPVPPEPVLPDRIGKYDIQETLGRGAMGVVYKARDLSLDRPVALKMVTGVGSGALGRFWGEAKAIAKMQHPNVVQIYGIEELGGSPYLVLEYVAGGNLADKLRPKGLPPRAAAEMVAKLARAVDHAHQLGILHRDLKPSNILLTPDGEPKITDFGLAKMQENEPLSLEGQIIGTPSYMAPEQAAGKIQQIGPATDIYSLGAILYEALTGRPPFRGASVYETLSQLATDPVVAPQALNPAVSVDLSAICLKCLAKNRDERYASAKALAEDLEACLEGRPVVADVKPQLTSPAERKQPPQAIKDPVRRPWWKFWA